MAGPPICRTPHLGGSDLANFFIMVLGSVCQRQRRLALVAAVDATIGQ